VELENVSAEWVSQRPRRPANASGTAATHGSCKLAPAESRNAREFGTAVAPCSKAIPVHP